MSITETPAPLPGPSSVSEAHDIQAIMRFNSVNERGWLQRVEDDQPIFHFKYDNDFYGTCSFQAAIVETDHEVLRLDENTLKVEDYRIRKGSLPILVETAKVFLKVKLTNHTRLKQLENTAARLRRNLFDWRRQG